ncbi:MAG TPA: hypothetical protein VGI14_03045 [Casimicrobiaceae bacterium]
MSRYQPATFRASFAIAAVALSAITMVVAVGVPSAACDAVAKAAPATQVAITPARIDVVATRVRLAQAELPHVD